MPTEKLLSPRKVAETLDLSIRSIYRLIEDGCFVSMKINGSIRITESSLNRYVQLQIDNFLENCPPNHDSL